MHPNGGSYQKGGILTTKFNMKNKIMINHKTELERQNPAFLVDAVIGRLSSELNKKLEDYIIEGLKRKGFEFKNRLKLENFIKNNCRCEDRPNIKERVYFANDIPFFLHKYEIEMTNPITIDREVKISANYGSYAYLQHVAISNKRTKIKNINQRLKYDTRKSLSAF